MAGREYLLIVFLIHLVYSHEESAVRSVDPAPIYGPSWLYKCVPDEGCQRSDKPLPLTGGARNLSSNIFDSLNLCRTVCGRFGGLWPKPVTASLSTNTIPIHPNNLRFDLQRVPAEVREIMAEMTHLASENLMAECRGNVSKLVDTPVIVYLTVASSSSAMSLDTNEEYSLDVENAGNSVEVHIAAETIFGARHALETFTQLATIDQPDYSDQCGLRLVAGAKIRDRPVYKYRGFLLDTSRNFFPMSDIKRMINGMAATKLNVFHWHVTDSHSFPLESARVPQFTRYGAYSPEEIYTVEEVRQLIHFALVRGIRVVIEIDAPAHAGNGWQWGKDYGLGDLAVCVNAKNWRALCIEPPCGQLNPANPNMYQVLRDLYRDIAEALPKPALFHMGGDEVFLSCWNSSEEIVSYMKEHNLEITKDGFINLWGEFHGKALQLWDEVYAATGGEGQDPVMLWSSELTQANRIQKHLPKDRYIITVWEPISSPLLSQLLQLGYRVISVPKDIWYLDHGFWGITKYSNWRRMYAHTLPKHENVLGGQVAMWSEYVDSNDLDGRVWPRAAAVAERLWSDPVPPATANAAEPRLLRLMKRLESRGLHPDAASPEWCKHNDGRCL